jgi:hypothetical protein
MGKQGRRPFEDLTSSISLLYSRVDVSETYLIILVQGLQVTYLY